MKPDPLLTATKFADLKEKLEHLKRTQPKAAAEVARLAELGDFSENTEYQMAKGRLRGINSGILSLQRQIDNAVLIADSGDTDQIKIGHTVELLYGDEKRTFKILGAAESNPKLGVISHLSPVGQSLIGKKVDQKFEISIGNKMIACQIISISYP